MDNQVNALCKAAYFHIRNISAIRKYLTEDTTKHLVHGLVTSRLDYGNSLLYGITQRNINKLQLIQNTSAHLITRTKKHDHITDVLRKLHWLPITERIKFKILLLTYRVPNGTASSYLCDLLTVYKPARCLRSSNQQQLVVPRVASKSFGNRAFYYAAPKLWNNLPCHIRQCTSIDTFKCKFKRHLFTQV